MRDQFRNKRTGNRSMTGISACRGMAIASMVLVLSGCVSSDPTLTLASADTQQSAPTPVLAVLAGGDNAAIASTDTTLQQDGNSVVIPTEAPRDPQTATTETENSQNVVALAVTSDAETSNSTQTVIDQSLAQSATDTPETTAQEDTAETQVAALSPDVETASTPQIIPQAEVKKATLLDRLFGNSNKPRNTSTRRNTRTPRENDGIRIASAHRTATRNQSVQATRQKTVLTRTTSANLSDTGLPGVKSNSELFGINDAELDDDSTAVTQVAAVGGLGRLSPNGIRIQHAKVQVSCLKPGVIRILKMVERRYGRKPIVTSGYRSPKRNRRAGGARNSQHIFCKAADIQVEGVSKWKLAEYLRSIPGRGGVGTYCRTKSVHFDIGSKRDWHHPCRRSKVKKRKKA